MSVDAVAQPPASETTTARAGLVLALIVTCQLMIVLDATVVNVALPPIQQDLGFSPTGLSWAVNAYTLAFGGLLLLGGRLGDAFGRRRIGSRGVCADGDHRTTPASRLSSSTTVPRSR